MSDFRHHNRPHVELPNSILRMNVEAMGQSLTRLWFLFALVELLLCALLITLMLVEFSHHGPSSARTTGAMPYPNVAPNSASSATGGFVPPTGTLTSPTVVPSAGTLIQPTVPATGTLSPPTAIGGGGLPGLPPRATGTP